MTGAGPPGRADRQALLALTLARSRRFGGTSRGTEVEVRRVQSPVVVVSRPVRRILCRGLRRGRRPSISAGGYPPAPAAYPGVSGRAVLPLLGLAPGGVYRAARVTPGAGALLPHRFTLTCAAARGPAAIGGLFSVALSCGSPRLGVTQHPALWSPDVPRPGHRRVAAVGPDAAAWPTHHRRHDRGDRRTRAGDRADATALSVASRCTTSPARGRGLLESRRVA